MIYLVDLVGIHGDIEPWTIWFSLKFMGKQPKSTGEIHSFPYQRMTRSAGPNPGRQRRGRYSH